MRRFVELYYSHRAVAGVAMDREPELGRSGSELGRTGLVLRSLERQYLTLSDRRLDREALPLTPSTLRAYRGRPRAAHLSARETIGKGAHGEVRLCADKATGSVYAIKCFGKQSFGDKEQVCALSPHRVAPPPLPPAARAAR